MQQQIAAVDTDRDCLLVCDREGDFYELFAECVKLKLPLLVRLIQNRSLKETVQKEGKILDALRAMKPAGTMEVNVSRNPAKKEAGEQPVCFLPHTKAVVYGKTV